ncbi:hypothetical protein DFS33DRAFT_1270084 [Desarmillaria ectypa]|nr:hypothetical protein DFS33DRAFT_1270084 [Desarmillaria ectypa]
MHPKQFIGPKKHNNDAERLDFLQQDPWIQKGPIKPQKVVCRGCEKAIHLEKRNTSSAGRKLAVYYLSPWVKHQNKCPGVHKDWLIENGYNPEIKLSKEILENHKQAS